MKPFDLGYAIKNYKGDIKSYRFFSIGRFKQYLWWAWCRLRLHDFYVGKTYHPYYGFYYCDKCQRQFKRYWSFNEAI